jgi:hypothetical protein
MSFLFLRVMGVPPIAIDGHTKWTSSRWERKRVPDQNREKARRMSKLRRSYRSAKDKEI